MIINTELSCMRPDDYSETLTKEQRKETRQRMAEELGELLKRSPRENLYWTESKTDLIDLVYEVFVSEHPISPTGRPYTFKAMARLACAVLHVPEPANFYSIIYNARQSKGIRRKPFFSRYCWLIHCKNVNRPLNGMIIRMNG